MQHNLTNKKLIVKVMAWCRHPISVNGNPDLCWYISSLDHSVLNMVVLHSFWNADPKMAEDIDFI